MARLSAFGAAEIAELKARLSESIENRMSLEDAAQASLSNIYDYFADSLVLARLFATVARGSLPKLSAQFVENLARAKGIEDQIDDQTLVLSLLGTRGREPAWNDRKKSEAHLGIPLASGDFITAIPMISRLLKEYGIDLDWIDSRDTEMVTRHMAGRIAGTFYVEDAASDVDSTGRKIIPDQDFVAKHGVKTVFGFGGGYITSATILVAIMFSTETLHRDVGRAFVPLLNILKAKTTPLVRQGKIFER